MIRPFEVYFRPNEPGASYRLITRTLTEQKAKLLIGELTLTNRYHGMFAIRRIRQTDVRPIQDRDLIP